MNIISKVGQRDNVVTYEHICDTRADMEKIEPRYITLGSTCIVLAGESGMEVYMADSDKEWHDLLVSSGGSGSGAPSGLSIHICGEEEVEDGMPNVLAPLETELYLVPAREESGNLYDEYVWVNGEWELFGGAPVSLEGVATEAWVSQQGYLTSHQDIPVEDVQVDGASVVNNGVASVPFANNSTPGVVKVNGAGLYGLQMLESGKAIGIFPADATNIKNGNHAYRPLSSYRQHESTFYGLAKAAGDTTQSASENVVGVYTDSAKSAIQQMLGINTAIATAIGNIHSFDVQVVQALPTENIENHTIYFVPKQGTTNDVYDEYLYVNNAWELIGNTQIDLTGYATQSYVNNALAAAETLPTPGANGTALVSVNGEWIKTPGYGYCATEDIFVAGNFTSADFTQEGAEYIAIIPLTEEVTNGLSGMLMSQEGFNVMIDDTIYNSVTDQFTFTEDGIYLQDVFKIKPNSDSTAVIFSVPTIPNSAKIYQTGITYTQFDRKLLPLDLNVENGTGTMAVLINDIEGNTASGNYATSEGYKTQATADYSHAEGYQSYANGQNSHAEGYGTATKGTNSHSEGSSTKAIGDGCHAEGYNTIAGGSYSHAEGQNSGMHTSIQITAEVDATNRIYSVDYLPGIKVDNFILATNINEVQKFVQIIEIDSENSQIKLNERVLVGQYDVYKYGAFGEASHIEGSSNIAIAGNTHAEGSTTIAKGYCSHAEGYQTNASGANSHAEGWRTISGDTSHSEGHETMANAFRSHTEGSQTITVYRLQDGSGAHAEGCNTATFGSGAHSEGVSAGYLRGVKVLLTGEQSSDSLNSHTVNYKFQTNTDYNFRYADTAVGMYLVYTGRDFSCNWLKITAVDTSNKTFQIINPHPALNEAVFMLVDNIAIGDASHTEGSGTQAIGVCSHAEGRGTIANDEDQHVQGRFNIEAPNNTYAHIVGNGTKNNRSNAHTLDWSGNAWYAGKVTAGTVASPANPTAANDLTTKQYVDNALAAKVVSIEGTTPAITAVADTQYICGEVSTLSFTPSATGTCDVIFESGAVATTLTVPSTVKFPEWFDASALEANTTYEINITNGVYGAVMSWVTA